MHRFRPFLVTRSRVGPWWVPRGWRPFSSSKYMLYTDKFNGDDFVPKGFKPTEVPTGQHSETIELPFKKIVEEKIPTLEDHEETTQLLEMLHDYNSLTLDLLLKDPVILESTSQRLLENAKDIISKPFEDSEVNLMIKNGQDRDLKVLIQLLCLTYGKSDSVKLITLNLLTEMTLSKPGSLQNNRTLITYFIKQLLHYNSILSLHLEELVTNSMSDLNQIPKEVNSMSYLTQYNFFKIIMMCALLSKNPLLASSLYISLISSYRIADSNFISYLLLNNELLQSTVSSLLINDPKNQVPNLLLVIRLYEFQNEKLDELSQIWTKNGDIDFKQFQFQFSSSQQANLLSIVLTLNDESHLPLKLYVFEKILKVKDNEINKDADKSALYLRYSYKLIESNINLNNDATVYFIWSEIEKYHTILYNAQINSSNNNRENNYYYYSILAKVIRFFSKNQRYGQLVNKMIQNLPIKSCSVNPDLMDALLTHAARTEDISLSNILIQQLGDEAPTSENYKNSTQLTRGQLSALLGLHLKFHDAEGAEKIMNLIYQRFTTGLDHSEMNMICKQMLSRKDDLSEQFNKVWQMFQSLDPYLLKSLSTLIIDHMIENKVMDFDKIEFIYNKLILNLKENDEIWEWISALYIKYLTRNFSLKRAKKVYQNSIRRPIFYNRLNNPFARPYDKAKIYLPLKLRKLVLKSIIDSSVFHKHDDAITFWCFDEVEKLGYGLKEVLFDLSLSKGRQFLETVIDTDLNRATSGGHDPLPILGLSPKEQRISTFFDKEIRDLYLRYLTYKK